MKNFKTIAHFTIVTLFSHASFANTYYESHYQNHTFWVGTCSNGEDIEYPVQPDLGSPEAKQAIHNICMDAYDSALVHGSVKQGRVSANKFNSHAKGFIISVEQARGYVYIKGWACSPYSRQIDVSVYITGEEKIVSTANLDHLDNENGTSFNLHLEHICKDKLPHNFRAVIPRKEVNKGANISVFANVGNDQIAIDRYSDFSIRF